MKGTKIVGLCLIFALAIVGGWAWGGIEGSKHDFSNRSWAGDDLCGACHTPHREKAPAAAPLWEPQADLSQRFGNRAEASDGPGPGTLVCLHCHDGTIAREAVAGAVGDRYRNKGNAGIFDIAHDATDHPVGVEYPQFDKGYRPAMSVIAHGTVALPNGKVECVSCHDPHNSSGVEPMLVTRNARSALCLTCHKK